MWNISAAVRFMGAPSRRLSSNGKGKSMSIVDIEIPDGARQIGFLRDDYEEHELEQDLVQVQLPNGATVDVSWYPEYESDGEFLIVGYEESWENPRWRMTTKFPHEAADAVQ